MGYMLARACRFDFPLTFWERVAREAPNVTSAKYTNAPPYDECVKVTGGKINFLPVDMIAAPMAEANPDAVTACWSTGASMGPQPANALLDERAAHEGWYSANDWQGFVPHELLPQVINPKQGWLVSANHRPIASFYPISIGISTGSLGDTDRSWRLKERVRAKESFTPEDVLDVHYDTVAPIKRNLVKLGYHLRDIQQYPLEEETRLALDYLEEGRDAGYRSEMQIKGTEILNLMPMAFRQNFAAATIYGGGLSGLCNMLQTIETRIAEDPKAVLTEEEADYVNLILRAAWRYGKANYGDDAAQWNEKARAGLLETRLPYMSTLDGFASLDEAKAVSYTHLTLPTTSPV